jgi:hypothetical protein
MSGKTQNWIESIQENWQTVLAQLFPSPIALVNFFLMLAFLMVLILAHIDTVTTMVAALGSAYSLNQWFAEVKRK